MSHTFRGERTVMRIHIGDADRCGGRPLYEALLEFLRQRGFAGATAIRGMAGIGAHARMHRGKVLRLSVDLPVIVEVVESEDTIREVLPDLDGMIDGGLVTLERARVILYRPHDVPEDQQWRHRIEGLEPVDENTST